MLYDPAISLPGIYRRDMKIYAHQKTCTGIFIVVLFILTKNFKQSTNCGTTRQRNIIILSLKWAMKIDIK